MNNASLKKNKRLGFTLVELLVVIAILAVLAAVSVVGYLSFIKKAKISNDISLTTQMNTVLNANRAVDGKNDTPHDAVEDLIDGGLDINKLTPTTDGYIYAYDLEEDRMILLDGNMNLIAPEGEALRESKIDYFIFIGKEAELTDKNYKENDKVVYSFYLKNGFTSDNSLEVSTGFDVGENSSITSITYNNSVKQTALIRSNGGELNITAPNDTISHYGWVKDLSITSVATADCWHEYGYVGNLTKFESGTFICHEGSEFHQTEDQIRTVLGNNGQQYPKGKYGQHRYDDYKCVIDNCTDPYDPSHTHTYTEIIEKNATCTEDGSKVNKCIECGYIDDTSRVTISALGHDSSNGYTIVEEATCTKKGSKTFTCSRCNQTITEEIPLKDHNYTLYQDNNDGTHSKKCSVCNNVESTKYDHTYGTPINNNGSLTHKKTCSLCNHEENENHNYIDGKCVCGAEEVISKEGLCSDGYYYKDNETYTGTITDGSNTYEYNNGRLVVTASVTSNISNWTDYKLTYDITSIDTNYVTKEILLKTSETLDSYVGEASVVPGNFTATNVVITSANNSYKLESIGVSYDKDFKGAIDYLNTNIGSKTKGEILNTLKSTYEFDESYYPLMTKSDDFNDYLNELNTKGIITTTTISATNYETIQNAEYTYGQYLKNKYSVSNILDLSWATKVNYYYSSYGAWPSSNKTDKKNGIFSGDIFGYDYTYNDPELILLYFKHTYDNILFTGISSDQTKTETLLSDMYYGNNNVYSFDGSDWMSKIANSYGLSIESLYKYCETKTMDISALTDKTNFYMFTASHQWLMTNMYQDRTFVSPTYNLIAENPNWKLSQ